MGVFKFLLVYTSTLALDRSSKKLRNRTVYRIPKCGGLTVFSLCLTKFSLLTTELYSVAGKLQELLRVRGDREDCLVNREKYSFVSSEVTVFYYFLVVNSHENPGFLLLSQIWSVLMKIFYSTLKE